MRSSSERFAEVQVVDGGSTPLVAYLLGLAMANLAVSAPRRRVGVVLRLRNATMARRKVLERLGLGRGRLPIHHRPRVHVWGWGAELKHGRGVHVRVGSRRRSIT